MARNNQGNRNSSNSEKRGGRASGVATIAREQPARTAVIAAAAVGAGVFLWSRRNQISEQISSLSEQFGEWSQNSGSGGNFDSDTAGLTTANTGSAGMSETGGGNASLSASTGGSGSGATSSATGRGQTQQSPTT
jgi:hypothetical protein